MFIAQATNCSFTLIVIYNYYMFIVQATDIMIIMGEGSMALLLRTSNPSRKTH